MTETGSGEKPSEIVAAALDDDSELQAIHDVLAALVPLKREGRSRVLDYALKRLGMLPETGGAAGTNAATSSYLTPPPKGTPADRTSRQADIRSLKNEKLPRSANEMAALVAYYLSEAAPEIHRKQTINSDDIKTYFKQAPFKLPSSAMMTLVNAKNAGYLESTGEPGQYRLNPVGYNLVAHNLPAGKARITKKKKAPPKGAKSKNASRKPR
ncbi:MAG: hypothetical protein WB780_06705 [Candidatus Acidiferrales bacterium]